MSLVGDLKILYHLALAPVRGETHRERLESFYSRQSEGYDDFRQRLLPGRAELFTKLPAPEQGVWLDLGGGTGANLEHLGPRLRRLKQVYVVDLSESLLSVAQRRIARHGWTNVATLHADVTQLEVPQARADVITFSYSLTMIPDWYAALERAWQLLAPGGWLGVVDFYVTRKYPAEGRARQSAVSRTFWTTWFAGDNVFLSADHLPYLERRFETSELVEGRARLPYLPLLRVPYYRWMGRKTA